MHESGYGEEGVVRVHDGSEIPHVVRGVEISIPIWCDVMWGGGLLFLFGALHREDTYQFEEYAIQCVHAQVMCVDGGLVVTAHAALFCFFCIVASRTKKGEMGKIVGAVGGVWGVGGWVCHWWGRWFFVSFGERGISEFCALAWGHCCCCWATNSDDAREWVGGY